MRAYISWLGVLLLTACADADGDGVGSGRDCDDGDPRAFPDAAETCDGVDNDCDGQIDEDVAFQAWQDRDGDGYGDPDRTRRVCALPSDGVLNGDDCNDLDAGSAPGLPEVCDGNDNDCNGAVDDGVGATLYRDADGDGHGVPGETSVGCLAGPGWAPTDDDCDDAEPLAWTGAPEVCDGVDNDCAGGVDDGLPLSPWPRDLDGDGFGSPAAFTLACGPDAPGAARYPDDCDDGDASHNPLTPESTTPGADDDCDGFVDELHVPLEAPTVEAALALVDDGEVIEVVGTVEGSFDLRGRAVVLGGRGCDRAAVVGDGAGPAVSLDGGALVGLSVLGGVDSGVVISGDAAIRRACVTLNQGEDGGGVRVVAGSVVLEDTVVADNHADRFGGGVAVLPGAAIVGRRLRVLGNDASEDGGGLHLLSADATLRASVIAGNQAWLEGGGVMVEDDGAGAASLDARFCTFVANEARYDSYAGVDGSNLSKGAALRAPDVNASVVVTDSVLAFHALDEDTTDVAANDALFTRNLWAGNTGRDQRTGWSPGTRRGDPRFVRFDPAEPADTWDLRLRLGSAAIDAADLLVDDVDGSRADLGAYGGPDAPADALSGYAVDLDADGMYDGWERAWGGVVGWDDAGADHDGDGLDLGDEHDAGARPDRADTDGDGVTDVAEVGAGDDPADPSDHAPFAAIEVPRVWVPGEALWLDGSGSYDPSTPTPGLLWAVVPPAGSRATAVSAPRAAFTSFTPDVSGSYTFTLVVTGASTTAESSVVVNVREATLVPDDYDDLPAAFAAVAANRSIALRPGTWTGGLDTTTYTGTIFGLGRAEDVVVVGAGDSVVDVQGGVVRLHQLTITGGTASQHGGGVRCDGTFTAANLYLVDVIVRENTADDNGGGVYLKNCPLVMDRSTVRDNDARNGGGLFAVSSYAAIDRSAFIGNTSSGKGGGFRYDSTSPDRAFVRNTLFQGNVGDRGGAISVSATETNATLVIELNRLTLVDNDGPDGAVRVDRGRAILFDSLLGANRGTFALDARDGELVTANLGSFSPDAPLFAELVTRPADLVEAGPSVVSWVDDGDPDNDAFGLRPGSAFADAGSLDRVDLDGSRMAIGLSGGSAARRSLLIDGVDADGDGMSDGWELRYGQDPGVADRNTDHDGDGKTAIQEYQAGTLPDRRDTNGDGVPD